MKNKYTELFEQFLNLIEFDLVKIKNTKYWRLKDRQGGNLGNIESDNFKDAYDIIGRLDAYINDYLLEAFEDSVEEKDLPKPFDWMSYEEIIEWYNKDMKAKYPDMQWDMQCFEMFCNTDKVDLNEVYHEEEELGLPSKCDVSKNYLNMFFEYNEDKDIDETLGDYLSNEFGFCVNSFDYEEDETTFHITNIDWDIED